MKMRNLLGGVRLPLFLICSADNGDAPGDGGGGGDGAPGDDGAHGDEDVFASVTDVADRDYITKNGYKSWADVLKTARHQEALIGTPKDQLLKLPADRTPDKMGDVFSALGKPKDVDGYGVKEDAERGLDGARLQGFLKVAHEQLHLLPWQVQGLLKWQGDEFAALKQAAADKSKASFDEGLAATQSAFGEAYDEKLAAIDALLAEHGDLEFKAYLEESGLGNDVRFAKFLDKIAGLVSESPVLPGDPGRITRPGGKLSPDEARSALAQFEQANDAALRDKGNSHHGEMVRERERLIALAYPEPDRSRVKQ